MNTRSGEQVSAQVGKMGSITNLTTADFQLDGGHGFNIKNDGLTAVTLTVQLVGMSATETVQTTFEPGWNPEIVKVVKQTSIADLNLKWGY